MLFLLALLLLLLIAPSADAQGSKAGKNEINEKRLVKTDINESYVLKTEVRPLPGALDGTLMFNSNSPEVVKTKGILLSLLPPEGKAHPDAHLNFPMVGRHRLFMHHINNKLDAKEPSTLYIGLIAYNPSSRPATIKIVRAASYLSRPDAPFISLEPFLENDEGRYYSGPGDRVMLDFLRNDTQNDWPDKIRIPGCGYALIANLPIPVTSFKQPLNGRSTLMELISSRPVHYASLGMDARDVDGSEPNLIDWIDLAAEGNLALERDKTPTPPGAAGPIIFGRVAGVQKGAFWVSTATDDGKKNRLTLPPPGCPMAFPLSTVTGGTFATGQVQSAPLLVRYPDTAYQAHGNYGVEYNLTFPLYNSSESPVTAHLYLDTPVKTNKPEENLTYLTPPPERFFFRGSAQVTYRDDRGKKQSRVIHLVEKRGTRSRALLSLCIGPAKTRRINLRLLYPPDATPPQVVTIETMRAL